MFKRILVPVDGTEATEQVVHAGIELARQLQASITCFLTEPASAIGARRRTGDSRRSKMLSSTHPRCWPGHINCCGSSKTVPAPPAWPVPRSSNRARDPTRP